jgi:hypothetical protein
MVIVGAPKPYALSSVLRGSADVNDRALPLTPAASYNPPRAGESYASTASQ